MEWGDKSLYDSITVVESDDYKRPIGFERHNKIVIVKDMPKIIKQEATK